MEPSTGSLLEFYYGYMLMNYLYDPIVWRVFYCNLLLLVLYHHHHHCALFPNCRFLQKKGSKNQLKEKRINSKHLLGGDIP